MQEKSESIDSILDKVNAIKRDYLTINELSKVTGITYNKLISSIYRNKLNAGKDGKRYKIYKKEIPNYIKHNCFVQDGYLPLKQVKKDYFKDYTKSEDSFITLVKK